MKTFRKFLQNYTKSLPKSKRCLKSTLCNPNNGLVSGYELKAKKIIYSFIRYRPIGGYCNNINHPKYGASKTPYNHMIKPIFDDGITFLQIIFEIKSQKSKSF